MEFKKITAIIRGSQLDDVEARLKGQSIPGITVDFVKGYGETANFFSKDWVSRYARIEIVAEKRLARQIIDTLMDVVHTGAEGDGVVYTVPVEAVHRIRDGHRERSDSTCPHCRASHRLQKRQSRKPAATRARP